MEKPISHNVREGRLMVKAARKYDRVVQVGTQLRSRATVQAGIEYARQGKRGKLVSGHRLVIRPADAKAAVEDLCRLYAAGS